MKRALRVALCALASCRGAPAEPRPVTVAPVASSGAQPDAPADPGRRRACRDATELADDARGLARALSDVSRRRWNARIDGATTLTPTEPYDADEGGAEALLDALAAATPEDAWGPTTTKGSAARSWACRPARLPGGSADGKGSACVELEAGRVARIEIDRRVRLAVFAPLVRIREDEARAKAVDHVTSTTTREPLVAERTTLVGSCDASLRADAVVYRVDLAGERSGVLFTVEIDAAGGGVIGSRRHDGSR